MPKEKPLISVIIPCYNYGRFIGEAIDSALNQDFPQRKIEVIVIDDGSIDNTREVVARYKDKVKYIYQENSGAGWAAKTGIDIARGEYIFNLDADDIFLPGKIKRVVDIFESDKDIVHIAHPVIYWYMDKDIKKVECIPDEIKGRKIYGKDLLSYFYKRNKVFGGGSTISGRAGMLKKISIPKEISMFIDEYIILFNLNSGCGFFIEEPLSVYRIHGKNYSIKNVDEKIEKNFLINKVILSEILKNNFEDEIKVLYTLKTTMSMLRFKEMLNKKSVAEIVNLWVYIFKNLRIFGKDIFRIIKNYRVLQRSLPTFVVDLARNLKSST